MSSSLLGSELDTELQRRARMWADLVSSGGPLGVPANRLRDIGIYGGASGIWVNKEATGGLTQEGQGVAVSVLHNGSSYPDDLTEDGLIYHFPATNRVGRRDAAETAALIACGDLELPIFVITHSDGSRTRTVRRGKLIDVDRSGAVALISFDPTERRPRDEAPEPFRLEASRAEKRALARRLVRSARFKFNVGRRVGWKCALCGLGIVQLLDAAHIRGVAEGGSDDPRNGLMLCFNHHRAFDVGLFGIEPTAAAICPAQGHTLEALGITVGYLPDVVRPHIDALMWRWRHQGIDRSKEGAHA